MPLERATVEALIRGAIVAQGNGFVMSAPELDDYKELHYGVEGNVTKYALELNSDGIILRFKRRGGRGDIYYVLPDQASRNNFRRYLQSERIRVTPAP